jgi:hypothetical protein
MPVSYPVSLTHKQQHETIFFNDQGTLFIFGLTKEYRQKYRAVCAKV